MIRARRAVVALTAVVVALVPGVGRAVADEPVGAYAYLEPVSSPGTPVSGPFTLTATVLMRDSAWVDVSARVDGWWDLGWSGSRRVTAADCPGTCTVSWEIDPTSEALAWPTAQAWGSVSFSHDLGGGAGGGALFDYRAPVDRVGTRITRDETTAVRDYRADVLDTGGELVLTSDVPRGATETVVGRVESGVDGTALAQLTGTWDAAPDADGRPVGRVRFDTARLPAGRYDVVVRGRDGEGRWGQESRTSVLVRHSPVVSLAADAEVVAVGRPVRVAATLARPWATTGAPDAIEVTVDDRAPVVLSGSFYGGTADTATWWGSVEVPAAALPEGAHVVRARVLTATGRAMGGPAALPVRVVRFGETVTVPTLVVGRTATVRAVGTAPSGLAYASCSLIAYETGGQAGSGPSCARGARSFDLAMAWTPTRAGAGRVELGLDTQPAVGAPGVTVPVTVHAARRVALSAPTTARYGSTLTATVDISDEKVLGRLTPVSGLSVSLQRKPAGSATWTTIGTGRTAATGRASIRFSDTVNGRLRAVVASAVPGQTVSTAERSVWSTATVAWSSLPTSARVGSTVAASVRAGPVATGSRVRVQARRAGTDRWLSFTSVAVGRTGAARPTARLGSRGTWEVRVQRIGTTAVASGYSSVRHVAVR